MKTIFISKDFEDLADLDVLFERKDVCFNCHSLIDFEPISFSIPISFEVLFFSSIRCAQFIENNKSIDIHDFSLACAGPQTAHKLECMGYQVDFVGQNASSPEHVAKDFESWLGERTVFIPRSNRSLRSIEAFLNKDQVESSVVYNTNLQNRVLEKADILVFTSPSNVDAYFQKNTIDTDTKLISWGASTSSCLSNHGHHADFVLKEGRVAELKELLMHCI